MTYEQAIEYINSLGMGKKEPGLEKMRKLMARLGDPQNRLRYVHVAGTNGKGSVCAMLESILREAGYKTGLYTSPYIRRFNERIRVNGQPIPDDALAKVCERVKAAVEETGEKYSEFEFDTAMGFLYFAEENCGIVVLETGLGGRFDPTNIIPCPECAVIMNIGLDHTDVLGDTVEKIAMEKAGIIKEGCTVALYEPEDEALIPLFARVCREKGASLRISEPGELETLEDSLEGQRFCYCYDDTLELPLLGDHQLKNAAVALEAVEILRERGFNILQGDVEEGMRNTHWPARFELVHRAPYVIVDGGHNPQCAETVAENMYYYFEECRRVFLFGIMADKDVDAVCDRLATSADAFVCVTPDSPRALPAEKLAERLAKYNKACFICGSLREGIKTAMGAAGKKGAVCCVGSLYMAGDIREYFGLK